MVKLEQWIVVTSMNIVDPGEQRYFVQFARWRHLRALRIADKPASAGTVASRRRELTLVVELLSWARQQGRSLAELTQADVDRWRAHGPEERHRVKAFLVWSRRNGHSSAITVDYGGRVQLRVTGVSDDDRLRLLSEILRPESAADALTRLAGALVLLYGFRVVHLVTLRLEDVAEVDEHVSVRLGKDPLVLPDELIEIVATAIKARSTRRLFAPVDELEWLFPGSRSGRPMSADALTDRLTAIGVVAGHSRSGALSSLAQRIPSPILARLTGMHASTAVRWTASVATSNSRYAALKLRPQ